MQKSEENLTNTLKNKQQWLSGRVLEARVRDCKFEPHRCHWVESLRKTH